MAMDRIPYGFIQAARGFFTTFLSFFCRLFSSMAMAYGFIQAACGFFTAFRRDLPWWFRWEIGLSAMTVVSECISATLEQASPHKLMTAEYGLIMATVSLLLASADLAYQRYKYHKSTHNGRPHRPFKWEFACCFGLLFSVLTVISASLHFHYLRGGKQQPIRFSMIPLAFSVCVFCSTIFRRPSGNSSLMMGMECRRLGTINVEVEVEQLYGQNGHLRTIDVEGEAEQYGQNGPLVQFPCPFCRNLP